MADLFHRVSIRKYQEKKVEPEKLDYILRASMAAPSACNQQPWEFYKTHCKSTDGDRYRLSERMYCTGVRTD